MIKKEEVSKGDLVMFNYSGELKAGFVTNLYYSGELEDLKLLNLEIADYGLVCPSNAVLVLDRKSVLELTAVK